MDLSLTSESLTHRARLIQNSELKERVLSAINALELTNKVPVITEAIKTMRKQHDPSLLILARDLAILCYQKHPGNHFILGELCIIKLFLKESNEVINLIKSFFDNAKENHWELKDKDKAYLSVTLAHAYSHEGELNNGIKILKDLQSVAANVLEALGELYYKNNEHEKAIDLLSTKQHLTVKMARWLAKSYLQLGKTHEAQEILKQFEENRQLKDIYDEIYKERGVVVQANPTMIQSTNGVNIFISHSSNDIDIVKKLQKLLCASLGLNKNAIRCTSVAGSRLAVGSDTSTQLANDILSAHVFIGLITEKSIQSVYVLFELGAAWIMDFGNTKHVTMPLLGRGVSYDVLPGPFKTRHAARAEKRSDVLQMLVEIATTLEISLLPPHEYEDELNDLCA